MDAYCPIIVPMCCDICGLPRFVFAKTWRMLWGRCLDMEAGLSEYVTNWLLLVSCGCRVEYPMQQLDLLLFNACCLDSLACTFCFSKISYIHML